MRRSPYTFALVVGALLAWAPVARPGAAQDLDRVVTQATSGWLERRPHLATGLGVHLHDGRLLPVTESTVADDLRWLEGLAARLEAVPAQSLKPERRAERERLAGWIAHQRMVLAEIEPHAHDPGHVLPVVEGSIRSLLESEAIAPCDRVRAVTARLRRVPEVVRSARVLLREPSRPTVTAAIAGIGETLDFLRVTVPALTRDCRESGVQADLAEADSAAVRALEDYRVALREDLLPRAVRHAPLGREALTRLLAAAEMETGSPDSLLVRAEREIAQRRAQLEQLAGQIVPGGRVAAALAAIERDSIPDGSLPAAIASSLVSLRAGIERGGWLALPRAKDLEVRWTLVPGRERPPVRLIAYGPFERGRRRTRLVYESAGAARSAAGLEARHALLSAAGLPWALVREAIPGRWPLEAARRTGSRVSQAMPAASAVEGWGTYAETLAREQGLVESGPRSEFAAERRALERLSLCAAALSLHLRGISAQEAADRLAERALIHPENAARAAVAALTDPLAAIAPVLGGWRIAELEEESRARLVSRFSLRRFHDALLAQGPVPLPLAREQVLRALEQGSRPR